MKLQRDLQMSAISNPAESKFPKDALPAKRQLVEKVAIDPAHLKDDQIQSERPTLGKRVPLVLVPITFCIGVAANLAWQSYGDAVRKAIASSFPQLGWSAPQAAPIVQSTPDMFAPIASAAPFPDQPQLNAMSLDLDAVRQRVDQIATSIAEGQEQMTRSIDRIAASQEQMARTVDRLAAAEEQVTREITKMQAIEQYVLYKNSEPPAPKRVPRQSQARTAQ
jgi:methyl-accepting chemotaxis protein